MDHPIVRASVLDVVPHRPLAFAADIVGRAVDVADGVRLESVDVALSIGDDLTITAFSASTGELALVGHPAGHGFRAGIDRLRRGTAAERLLRRVLWDVPILAQVAGQTALLDHDGARADLVLGRRGTDPCSGWRADGQMMQQVNGNGGVLVMPLGPERQDVSPAAPWLPGLLAPRPMATRRSRVLKYGRPLAAGRYGAQATLRDSYGDPDGHHRALHEWSVQAEYEPAPGRFRSVTATPGRLPWVECPLTGASAERLAGLTPAGVDEVLGSGFDGVSTCTHLNDTLRSLVDVADLAAATHPEGS